MVETAPSATFIRTGTAYNSPLSLGKFLIVKVVASATVSPAFISKFLL